MAIGVLLLLAECDGGDIKDKSPCEMSLDNSNYVKALISFRRFFAEIASTHTHTHTPLVPLKVLCCTSHILHCRHTNNQLKDIIFCITSMEIYFTGINCVISVWLWGCTGLASFLLNHYCLLLIVGCSILVSPTLAQFHSHTVDLGLLGQAGRGGMVLKNGHAELDCTPAG